MKLEAEHDKLFVAVWQEFVVLGRCNFVCVLIFCRYESGSIKGNQFNRFEYKGFANAAVAILFVLQLQLFGMGAYILRIMCECGLLIVHLRLAECVYHSGC